MKELISKCLVWAEPIVLCQILLAIGSIPAKHILALYLREYTFEYSTATRPSWSYLKDWWQGSIRARVVGLVLQAVMGTGNSLFVLHVVGASCGRGWFSDLLLVGYKWNNTFCCLQSCTSCMTACSWSMAEVPVDWLLPGSWSVWKKYWYWAHLWVSCPLNCTSFTHPLGN